MKVHFGDYWISTSGTDILITAWFENGWTNCTVYASGTQQIYNGSKPEFVWINGILRDEGSGWTYTSGIVIITSATSSFSLYWGTLEEEAPTYSNISHNTSLVNNSCLFSCLWTDGGGLSGFIFSYKVGATSWANDSWQSLSGTSAWANVSKILPNIVGTNVYYRWFCNDTGNVWSNTASATSLTTIGYYFYFDHEDLDFNNIDSIITWTLWKNGSQITYTEGAIILIAGAYQLKSSFRGHQINTINITTASYGNNHVPVSLYVKKFGSTTRYVAFDKPMTWISLNTITDSLTDFTVSNAVSNVLIVVDVPRECLYIQKNGINETGWTYLATPSKHEYKTVSSLSTWEFYHPSSIIPEPITPNINPYSFLSYIWSGDFLGLLQAIWISAFGSMDLLYAFIIMAITVPIYIRAKSLIFLCIIWILLGSIVVTTIPSMANTAVLLMGMALGGLLFKLFMHIRQ
jgi:hypothetical protein